MKIVYAIGCFDMLHKGHVMHLQQARDMGDLLIVAITPDKYIKKSKGERRPIVPEEKRLEAILKLPFVNKAYIRSGETGCHDLRTIRPDVYVKGGEYDINTINQDERRIVEGYGGQIKFTSLVRDENGEKISTTNLCNKLK